MIVIRVLGGLGNQLFIFAFSRALEIEFNKPVYLDINTGFIRDHYKRKFILDSFTSSYKTIGKLKAFYYLLKSKLSSKYSLKFKKFIVMTENDFETFSAIKNQIAEDNIFYIQGYWQDPSYFIKHLRKIKSEIILTLNLSEKVKKLISKVEKEDSVAIHVRRLDYNLVCSEQYYVESIDKIKTKLNNPIFYCFSDSPEWCIKNFGTLNNFYIIDDNFTDIESFQIMCRCQAFIISNSTYSWWAALLSNSENKEIILPDSTFWPIKKLANKNYLHNEY